MFAWVLAFEDAKASLTVRGLAHIELDNETRLGSRQQIH